VNFGRGLAGVASLVCPIGSWKPLVPESSRIFATANTKTALSSQLSAVHFFFLHERRSSRHWMATGRGLSGRFGAAVPPHEGRVAAKTHASLLVPPAAVRQRADGKLVEIANDRHFPVALADVLALRARGSSLPLVSAKVARLAQAAAASLAAITVADARRRESGAAWGVAVAPLVQAYAVRAAAHASAAAAGALAKELEEMAEAAELLVPGVEGGGGAGPPRRGGGAGPPRHGRLRRRVPGAARLAPSCDDFHGFQMTCGVVDCVRCAAALTPVAGAVQVRTGEHGRGVLAACGMAKNAIVAEYFGAVYAASDARAYMQPGYTLDAGGGAVIVAHANCAARYFNHSFRSANVTAELWRCQGRSGFLPRVYFRLTKCVAAGTELQFQYSKGELMMGCSADTLAHKRKIERPLKRKR